MEKSLKKLSFYSVTLILLVLMLIPLIWVVFLSFKTSYDISFNPLSIPDFSYTDNFVTAWEYVNIPRVFLNTIVISFSATIAAVFINIPNSYALIRFKLKSRKLQNSLFKLYISGLCIPMFILVFPIYRIIISLNLMGTYWALILPYLGFSLIMNTLLYSMALKGFPDEIEEAAIIDGCGIWQLMFKVVLPVIKPVIATVFIFNIINCWNEFPVASVMINSLDMQTVALSIQNFRGMYNTNLGGTAAYVVIILVPQIIIYLFFQKYIIEGLTTGAVKG